MSTLTGDGVEGELPNGGHERRDGWGLDRFFGPGRKGLSAQRQITLRAVRLLSPSLALASVCDSAYTNASSEGGGCVRDA